jgi:hypothetical protein
MSKVKSLPLVTTRKEKTTQGQRESCIILKKGEKIGRSNPRSDDKKEDKNE